MTESLQATTTVDDQPLPSGPRIVRVPASFSLRENCAPVGWAAGRWPHWSWQGGEFGWAGWDGDRPVWRGARLVGPGVLSVHGDAPDYQDSAWARGVLGVDVTCPPFSDSTLEAIRARHSGLCPLASGSLFDGLVTSIVGQSITVKAAAVVLGRVSGLFAAPIGPADAALLPLPRPDHLAEADRAALRATGLTWRRADAIIAAGRSFADATSDWNDPNLRMADIEARLRSLPLVGPWTAHSALLWGIAAVDVHVSGDVALLRAARAAYDEPTWAMRDLDRQAETWRPARAWAARLLWSDLLGIAPEPATGAS